MIEFWLTGRLFPNLNFRNLPTQRVYVPKGYGHALRNESDQPVDILVVFNAGDYQSIDLNDWIATNPSSVLGNTFQISPELVDKLPRRDQIFIAPPHP